MTIKKHYQLGPWKIIVLLNTYWNTHDKFQLMPETYSELFKTTNIELLQKKLTAFDVWKSSEYASEFRGPLNDQWMINALHKKWSFSLRISSVNVTKSTENCRFGHIYWKNPDGKLHFLCSDGLALLLVVTWLTLHRNIAFSRYGQVLFPVLSFFQFFCIFLYVNLK